MDEQEDTFDLHKQRYLNSSDLVNNFKKSYLTSLQIFLDDDKFKEKTDILPLLKSSAINKYEKMFARREQERKKLINKNIKINSTESKEGEKNNVKSSNSASKKKILKTIQIRYIVIDNQLVNITLKSIEENYEINKKLTDPFSSYFHEINPKIRKKAMDQIINNIFIKPTLPEEEDEDIIDTNRTKTESNSLPQIKKQVPPNQNPEKLEDSPKKNNNYDDYVFYRDLEALENKFRLNTEHSIKNHEKYKEVMKKFDDNCESHNIKTLGQKIDYFVYLFNTNSTINPRIINDKNHKSPNINSNLLKSKKNFKNSSVSIMTKSGQKNSIFSKRISKASDLKQVYYYEIKNNFKISDDLLINDMPLLEKFEKELNNKIKNFQMVKTNLEKSQKLIDKLKLYLLNQEISSENLILRECNITSEKFVFLLYKKYFDFSKLKQLNLSKNNLGDTGGSYVLFLVTKYSSNIEYLNISYNSLGKNFCENLIDCLSNNTLRVSSLSIAGNKLGDKLFSEVSIGISKNLYLNKLFIADNNLGKISSVVLGSILKYDKKIKLLDASKNNFGDEIIGHMLKGLIVNSTLESLFLNEMGLTNKSFRIFATHLTINTHLKQLFLERNKFNNNGSKVLCDLLNNNKYIEYISLVGNNFDQEHINFIIEQQRQVKLRVISKSEYFIQISSIGGNLNLYEYLE